MALFVPSLKRSGHLDQIHITVGVVGSRKIAIQDDYGSQGWEMLAPNLTIYGFDADPDACNAANSELAAREIEWTEKHLPTALWNSEGESTLYITKYPGCSSLYPPSDYYIERFVGNSNLIELVSTEQLTTTTLDRFCQSEGINEIDFIQLDVQGAELPVLAGAASILAQGTLGILTEVEFTEIYTGQPLFGDVDVYLRGQGFTLFDITSMHRDFRRMPIRSKKHQGSLIWGDAFYFRDLMRGDTINCIKTPEKILKLACIADILDFTDYALELLTYLTVNYGQDQKYNFADHIIEILSIVPGVIDADQSLTNLPLVEKIRPYSITSKSFELPIEIAIIEQQAYQYFRLGELDRSISLFEQAINLAPDRKTNYWYLGLLVLMQGEEELAQTNWFMAVADGTDEEIEAWTLELVEILKAESNRQEVLGNHNLSRLIRFHIHSLIPEKSINKLRQGKYCHLDEESVINKYINILDLEHKYCVDIAASDGITMSNTLFLFEQGWDGLAVEYNSNSFARLSANYARFTQVNLSKSMVTPDNVVALLKGHMVPQKFGFLNLDIDGYDYYVLDEILSSFRPTLICTEINEKIRPPLKFTVNWDSDYVWENNHFYGQSISQLHLLCEKYNYALVELHYNNAFLIPQELSPLPSLDPVDAYNQGYLDRADRQEKFPWNANMEEIHCLSDQDALVYVNNFFAKYNGKFVCSL